MDNDILINEAHCLYAALQVEQYTRSAANKTRFVRLERMVKSAYSRYQRRLNRCAVCYRLRSHDCNRALSKKCNPNLWKTKTALPG